MSIVKVKKRSKEQQIAVWGIIGIVVISRILAEVSVPLGIGAFIYGMFWLKKPLLRLAKAQKEAADHLKQRKNLPDEQQSGDPYVDFEQEYEEENVETILDALEAQMNAKKVENQTTTELVDFPTRLPHILIAAFLIGAGLMSRELGFEHWLFIVIIGAAWMLFRGINK